MSDISKTRFQLADDLARAERRIAELEETLSAMVAAADEHRSKAESRSSEAQISLDLIKGGQPVKKIFAVQKVITEAVSLALMGSNVRCEFRMDKDLRHINADEGQIHQVINNIVINAGQAMPEGGVMRIEARNRDITGKDRLPLADGAYLEISIEDEGVGIPEVNVARIFDPYFTTKQTGSGLGLAAAYSIIRNHEGHIAVESIEGIGSSFHIFLPASEDDCIQHEPPDEDAVIRGRGRILVVDDEEVIRESSKIILGELGYEVVSIATGTEAIEIYKNSMASGDGFDAVITDLTIPGGMGGKDLMRHLMKIDPDVKGIVSSGYSDDPTISHYMDYGFCGMIPKPYRIKDLSALLNGVIKDAPLSRELH